MIQCLNSEGWLRDEWHQLVFFHYPILFLFLKMLLVYSRHPLSLRRTEIKQKWFQLSFIALTHIEKTPFYTNDRRWLSNSFDRKNKKKPWDGTPAIRPHASALNLLFPLFFFKRHKRTRWQVTDTSFSFSLFCYLSISNESIHLPRAKGMRGENESHLWCPIVQRWLLWTSLSPAS